MDRGISELSCVYPGDVVVCTLSLVGRGNLPLIIIVVPSCVATQALRKPKPSIKRKRVTVALAKSKGLGVAKPNHCKRGQTQ